MCAVVLESVLHPLFRAAIQQGDIKRVVRYIADGRNVNSADQRRRTPLILAAQGGHLELCRLLLKHGANRDARDESGLSAIDVAKIAGWEMVVELLEVPVPGAESSIGESLEIESDSELFDDWEEEGIVSAPSDDGALRFQVIEIQKELLKCKALSQEGDWGRINIDLPSPSELTAAIELQRDDVQSLLATLLGRAEEFGHYRKSQIDAIARDAGGDFEEETARHLQQLMGDLGVFQDEDDDEWLSGSLIDESFELSDEAEDYWQYLRDLSAKTNDPFTHLSQEVERSVLLDRDGEERIGLLISLAINDAIGILSRDDKAIAALLELEKMAATDPYLVGKISRMNVGGSGDEHENLLISEKFGSMLKNVALSWSGEEGLWSSREIASTLEKLELTMLGIRMIHGVLIGLGSQNLQLSEVIERGARLEREMFMANLRLAISVAQKYNWSKIPKMDRVQESFLGLLKAVEKFDFQRGYKFSTYATWWLKQAVTRAIADKGRLIRVPVHMMERLGKISKSARLAGFDSPLEMPISELSDATGYSDVEILRGLSIVDDVSLWGDSLSDYDAAMSLVDESADPVAYTERLAVERIVQASIGELQDRQADVVRHRFGFVGGTEMTLDEVGQMYGVTRERIRQIEAKALKALRHPKSSVAVLRGYVGEKMDE